MDSYCTVEEILKTWDMEELNPMFAENQIDLDAFYQLDETTIKELIPKIGPRIKFLSKWRILTSVVTLSSMDNAAHTKSLSPCTETETDDMSNTSVLSNTSLELNDDQIQSPSNSSSTSNDAILTNYGQNAIVGLSSEEVLQTPAAKYSQTMAENLKNILESSTKGKSVLSYYKGNNGRLNSVCRNKLVEAIMENYLGTNPDRRLRCEDFEHLSEAVIGLFPNEVKAVYFSATYKTTNNKTRKLGSGKLFRKYYNMRFQMKKSGLLHSGSDLNTSTTSSDNSSTSNINDFAEKITWLQNCIDPWTDVQKYWNDTFQFRKKQLHETEDNNFSKFPCLKQPLGYTLLEQDFGQMFQDKELQMFAEWPKFSQKVIDYAKSELTGGTNEFVKQILQELQSHNSKELTEDGFNNRVLFLLPYILKPVTIKKNKCSGYWKPSKIEAAEGFILHIKDICELQNKLEDKKRKLQSFGLTLQPTPIVVGKNLDEVTSCYLFVDDHHYEAATPLKLVDMCFKIIHAQHFLYPYEAEQVWYLIQHGIYDIHTKWDKNFTSVSTVLASM